MAKILLVEDDINLREIYAARLSAEGYELAVASDGEEALSKAVAEKPNLIVLDVMMPKISGFDVLDILRSTEETKEAKVVMLSALSQPNDQERGEQLGADKYLIKSQITLEDVVETAKSMLSDAGSETSANASVVTTSRGRLPSNEDSSNDTQTQQQVPSDVDTDQQSSDTGDTPATNTPSSAAASSSPGGTVTPQQPADPTAGQNQNNAAPQNTVTPQNQPDQAPNQTAGNNPNGTQQTSEEISQIDSAMQQHGPADGTNPNNPAA